MSDMRQLGRGGTGKRRAMNAHFCPKCGVAVPADVKRCPSCGFTGADSVRMFPDPPPPLMPVLDAAGLWDAEDLKKIEAAREKLRRRFPQFNFHVCTVMLPEDTSLPAFGFWLLNVCPMYVGESEEERAWSVLFLIDVKSGNAAVVPGYRAEPWISDEDWKKVMSSCVAPWRSGKTTQTVIRFFETSASFLEQSWRTRGSHRTSKSRR